ncbi:hypothetical protein BCR43DRAFT_490506 [Syncephalastrum racemosum]|uniref:C3H1-type domain-containing protein n=1 Tax=Syncephalastrum racemosum TaxID=13706 RepID=A0A1X2HFZ5_SYNRA|nr:hypothetical protein BCR43DRAFT_490506 [Syncephalastrum racemosum]
MSKVDDPDFKAYLIREVENLCDADPSLVAQYITALVGSGEPPDALRSSLDEKLRDFFGNQTTPFIDRLLVQLGYGSNDPSHQQGEDESSSRRRVSDYSDDEDDDDRNFKHRRQRSDVEDEGHASRGDDRQYKRRLPDSQYGYGSNKQPRSEDYRGSRSAYNNNNVSSSTNNGNIPLGPAAMYTGQQAYENRARQSRPYRSRPLCRDYNEKGFCMRGDMCPYDHGADRIVVDDNAPFNGAFQNTPPPMGAPMPPSAPGGPFFGMPNNFDVYDPERATLPGNQGANMGFDMAPGVMMGGEGMPPNPAGIGGGRGARGFGNRGRGRGRGRGGRPGYFPSNRQNDNTNLVVENIPDEHCDIAKVNEFFKKFGTLTNISVQGHLHKALLQYATHAEASAAYNSPDPIFDNRFVKVYWQKDQQPQQQVPQQSQPNVEEAGQAEAPHHPKEPVKTEPTPEEVAAKAAEFNKLMEEKQKKHQERMKTILELQKQKEQLLQAQIAEQKRLMGKLTNNPNMSRAEKTELLAALKKIAADIDVSKAPTPATESTDGGESSEDLKLKLAKLEAEAASLGIIPQSSRGGRGGRGGFFGRGGWAGRGRGGGTPPQRYSLDNRPTKIVIKQVPVELRDDLRKHFENFGQVTEYENKDQDILVKYAARFEAEKAMAAGSNFSGTNLQMAWYTEPSPAPAPAPAPAVAPAQ